MLIILIPAVTKWSAAVWLVVKMSNEPCDREISGRTEVQHINFHYYHCSAETFIVFEAIAVIGYDHGRRYH